MKNEKLIVVANHTNKTIEAAKTIYNFDALSYIAGKAIEDELGEDNIVRVVDDGCELAIYKATKEEVFNEATKSLEIERIYIEGKLADDNSG